MAKKKKSVYEQGNQRFWQDRQWSSTLAERYPAVASIRINVQFSTDSLIHGTPQPKELNFRPDEKAYFHLQCPWKNQCVHGGFDFSEGVQQALKSSTNAAEGRLLCEGWEDQERIGRHRCMLEALYRVTVQPHNNNQLSR